MTWHRTITPDPVSLFRYSALTFNPHRIHYDRPYAMKARAIRVWWCMGRSRNNVCWICSRDHASTADREVHHAGAGADL